MTEPTTPTRSNDKPANAATAPVASTVLKERDAIRDAIATLIGGARRDIIIFAPQMDAHYFNGSTLARSLTSFAARHRYNLARILVEDATQVLRDNDRIANLCRRMAEFVQMHQVGEEHLGLRELFIVVDGNGYLRQLDLTEPECIIEPNGRQKAAELRQRFNHMWDRSEPATGLNTAGLMA